MSIEIDEVTGPAYWASALVNGDFSSLDDDEESALLEWCDRLERDGWYVVDVARDEEGEMIEPRFIWRYDLYGGTARGGDVCDYVVHRQVAVAA